MHTRTQTNKYVIIFYTINQVILAFLTYNLLEDRYTIDVITTKFLLLHFKMADSFEK